MYELFAFVFVREFKSVCWGNNTKWCSFPGSNAISGMCPWRPKSTALELAHEVVNMDSI